MVASAIAPRIRTVRLRHRPRRGSCGSLVGWSSTMLGLSTAAAVSTGTARISSCGASAMWAATATAPSAAPLSAPMLQAPWKVGISGRIWTFSTATACVFMETSSAPWNAPQANSAPASASGSAARPTSGPAAQYPTRQILTIRGLPSFGSRRLITAIAHTDPTGVHSRIVPRAASESPRWALTAGMWAAQEANSSAWEKKIVSVAARWCERRDCGLTRSSSGKEDFDSGLPPQLERRGGRLGVDDEHVDPRGGAHDGHAGAVKLCALCGHNHARADVNQRLLDCGVAEVVGGDCRVRQPACPDDHGVEPQARDARHCGRADERALVAADLSARQDQIDRRAIGEQIGRPQ